MSINKYVAAIILSTPLLSGCAPGAPQDTAGHYQALGGGWLSSNSAQAFGGSIHNTPIRGIFYSTAPPMGTLPSGTGWWLRSQDTDYYAPIDSITYNGAVVRTLTAAQGFFSVTTTGASQVVSGTFALQFQIGGVVNATLRLQSTQAAAAYGKYEAVWITADADEWSSFCPHPYVDSDGQLTNKTEYLIPVDGAKWLVNGSRVDDSASIQLSCTHDSVGGCIEWGYAPWNSVSGTSLKNTHQACTRMKRADFCGTGDPATTINQSAYLHTQIEYWDALGVHVVGAQTRTTMEAFWNPNGATCLNPSEYRSDLPNYVNHMQALVATCPKPACTKSSAGLTASARPCTAVDASTNTCTQN